MPYAPPGAQVPARRAPKSGARGSIPALNANRTSVCPVGGGGSQAHPQNDYCSIEDFASSPFRPPDPRGVCHDKRTPVRVKPRVETAGPISRIPVPYCRACWPAAEPILQTNAVAVHAGNHCPQCKPLRSASALGQVLHKCPGQIAPAGCPWSRASMSPRHRRRRFGRWRPGPNGNLRENNAHSKAVADQGKRVVECIHDPSNPTSRAIYTPCRRRLLGGCTLTSPPGGARSRRRRSKARKCQRVFVQASLISSALAVFVSRSARQCEHLKDQCAQYLP